MRKSYLWLFCGFILITVFGCKGTSNNNANRNGDDDLERVVKFSADKDALIRNPGMGWTIYDDANDEVADAATYWDAQDEAARRYASTFYIRWRWSDMEPEEGKYAWENDDNFKALVQGALDRGLRLAFRVYVNGQDNVKQGTPDFVFDAGAQYYEVSPGDEGTGKHKTPYPDDPIFQEKFTNFVQAFAAEFDDPLTVDYIDGYNLGWWGEGHHLKWLDNANAVPAFEWIINLYGNSFKHVPLVITMNSEIGIDVERTYAFEGQDYSPRRDGYGSQWFTESEKKMITSFFPQKMVVAEAAYWGDKSIDYANDIDTQFSWSSWNEYYKQVVNEALDSHANYLDLREAVETNRYVNEALDQVKKFMVQGGYRIYPDSIKYATKVAKDTTLTLAHSWKNIGVGVLPNNNSRWNYKYKVVFSLLDKNNKVVNKWNAAKAEPSDWLKDNSYNYTESFDLSKVNPGNYTLAVAIVNTQDKDAPGINLAVADENKIASNGWLKIGDIAIL